MIDLIKNDLLQPLDIKYEDDIISMGNFDDYYTYHQRRGHSTNFCKALEAAIFNLIT